MTQRENPETTRRLRRVWHSLWRNLNLHRPTRSGERGRAEDTGRNRASPVRLLQRFVCSERGISAVEFALIVPVVVLLMLGGFDFAQGFREKQRLVNAAQAGAQYAVQNRNFIDIPIADVEQRVRDNAADATNALDVAARYYCICPAGGPEVACNSGCGEPPRPPSRLVEVDVQYDVDLLFGYPGIQDPFPLRATTVMQVR